MTDYSIRANVIFFGLSESVSRELSDALSRLSETSTLLPIDTAEDCLRTLRHTSADLIFCPPDVQVIKELRQLETASVLVAVGRIPNVDDWLNAIEAGADDYCAAPFEVPQIRWILESNLGNQSLAA